MNKKTSAHYQREYRKRLREQGLVKKEVWVLPENGKRLLEIEKTLRNKLELNFATGVHLMTETAAHWTTGQLLTSLQSTELFSSGQASIELIDGIDPSIHIIMHEFGDLPIFLTAAGEQLILEALLWPLSGVKDVALFNETILRSHKYFPLSTISLDSVGGEDYYYMFGALSASSALPDIVLEIEALASNVIQATEVYREFIAIDAEAS